MKSNQELYQIIDTISVLTFILKNTCYIVWGRLLKKKEKGLGSVIRDFSPILTLCDLQCNFRKVAFSLWYSSIK